MSKKPNTLFRASIEVRNYSNINQTVLNPENADKVNLSLGLVDKPSKAEKIRKLLAENNKHLTFLLTIKEEFNYDEETNL